MFGHVLKPHPVYVIDTSHTVREYTNVPWCRVQRQYCWKVNTSLRPLVDISTSRHRNFPSTCMGYLLVQWLSVGLVIERSVVRLVN